MVGSLGKAILHRRKGLVNMTVYIKVHFVFKLLYESCYIDGLFTCMYSVFCL